MATAAVTDIGKLIERDPRIRSGWACVAGTATSVNRISVRYNLGDSPEKIAQDLNHLTLAQVYAALAYYFANREIIETELAEENAEADRLEQEYLLSQRNKRENIAVSR